MFKPQALTACALFAAMVAPAFATDVALATSEGQAGYGQWTQFNVSDIDSRSFSVEWIDLTDSTTDAFGTPLAFSFTIAAGTIGTLSVVDGAFAGDTFRLTNFGNLIGNTSAVATTTYADAADLGYDFDAAFGNASFSQGVFSLGAGSYRIGGSLDQSVTLDGLPLNATVGALRLTVAPVPEPSSYALLLAGLGVVSLLTRHRRR